MSTQRNSIGGFARRIRFLRGVATQEEFSRKIGISRSALANYESGRSQPSDFVLSQIAERTDMPASYFANPDLLPSPDNAAILGQMIEGRPGWTDDEIAIIRILRVCPPSTVASALRILISAATTEEITGMLGNIFSIGGDLHRLVAIEQRGGRFSKGPIESDAEDLLKALASRDRTAPK